METTNICKRLGVNHNTPIFFLISCVTLGFYFFYWALNFIREIVSEKDKKILTVIILAFATIQSLYACIPDAETMYYATQDATIYYIVNYTNIFISIILVAISITSVLLSKKHLENYLHKNNININIKTVWCIIFNFYYFYYIVNKLNTHSDELCSNNEQNVSKDMNNE